MGTLHINGRAVTIEAEDETPLLWIIRDTIGLTGTKFGCGIGMCGACTVHVGGRSMLIMTAIMGWRMRIMSPTRAAIPVVQLRRDFVGL
jgi:aerobic-type carbon monoxide dehydrogenase small subunit (CoxS/CutS family)